MCDEEVVHVLYKQTLNDDVGKNLFIKPAAISSFCFLLSQSNRQSSSNVTRQHFFIRKKDMELYLINFDVSVMSAELMVA